MSGLFKSTVIKGNKLTEFAQTSATVGITIPFGKGRYPVDGNVGWAPLPPKTNRTVKRQGKGGVKQEEFSYTMPYYIMFGKGPIFGFWWIKRNGKVVYTQDPAAPIEDQQYAAKWLQKVTFYYGTSSQMPDSTIESYEGTGMVSAHRGICGFVHEEDDVTEGAGAVPSYEAVPIATSPEIYLTSHPYAQTFYDQAKSVFRPTGGSTDTMLVETDMEEDELSVVFEPAGGALSDPPLPYLLDDTDLAFTPTGGSMLTPPTPYIFDATDNSFAPSGGKMKNPPEGESRDDLDVSFAPTGGTLVTETDGDWALVSRLMFEGDDGSTTFTDPTGKTWTGNGNAQIDTSLGDHRLLLDGSSDYLTTPSHADLTFGTGDFRIKFTLRYNSKAGYQTIMSCGYTVDNTNSFIVQTGNGNGLLNVYHKNTLICGEAAATINVNQDYVYEITRVSGITTIKRDGVDTAAGADTINYPAQQFSIGGGSSSGFNNYWTNGWLKAFEVYR